MNQDNSTSSTSKDERSTFSKVVETGFLILTWLALSSYTEIYGPTLIDLKLKLNANYEDVAIATSGRSYGWFPGSIVGGLLVDKFGGYCHLMIAVALDMAAGATMAIPLVHNVTYTWVFCFIGGCMESILNIAGTRIVFNIWKEKSVSPLMLIHLGYGIGSFIVPLYSNPFLADELHVSQNITNIEGKSTSTSFPWNNTTSEPTYGTSRIEYAYGISTAIVASLSIVFYVYQIRRSQASLKIDPHDVKTGAASVEGEPKRKTVLEMINPATCANGRMFYGMQILFLIFLYFGNLGGGDRMIGSFIRSYSVDQLHFSKTSASLINTAYWISFSIGRLLFSVISRFVSVRVLLIVQATGMAVSSTLLMFLADDDSLSFWIIIQGFAFFSSSTWPTGVAWTDYHIELTGLGMTWQILGASVGGICHLRLIGYLYEHVGPISFLYQTLGYGVSTLIIAVSLNLVGCQHGSRLQGQEEKEIAVSTIT
ncbi:hypothetical protein ACF0H5_000698 [Mactra antiquata]